MASLQSALPPTKPAPNLMKNGLHVSKYQMSLKSSLVSLHGVRHSKSLHVNNILFRQTQLCNI
jgi:hypothetical protein